MIQELATLDAQAIESHLYAADVVDRVVRDAFSFVQEKLPYEKEVQDFILKRFAEEGCETDHGPIVAYGANSANPHYAMEGRGAKCKPDDFVLIDLWCRQPGGVFADITRVGSLGKPTEKMQEAFSAVREAQKEGVRNVKVGARGCDVDTAARRVLEKKGFGSYVMHRLGHSIDTELHGSGAHLDSFEACDTRVIIPNTCYSVEPAVYIPGEFGLRLEHDILVTDRVRVTGGEQNEIYQL